MIAVADLISDEAYVKLDALQGQASAPESDPANEYDKATVLNASIKAWSYGEKLNAENIDGMSETTATWAFRMALFISLLAGGG